MCLFRKIEDGMTTDAEAVEMAANEAAIAEGDDFEPDSGCVASRADQLEASLRQIRTMHKPTIPGGIIQLGVVCDPCRESWPTNRRDVRGDPEGYARQSLGPHRRSGIGTQVTDHDAERRHEGPSYWVSTSLAELIVAEADLTAMADDWPVGLGIMADMRAEIARRQRCIKEATE